MKEYRLAITIDGESAKDLFCVGPNDLVHHFLPEYLNVDPDDVVKVVFFEDGIQTGRLFSGTSIHADNYYRSKSAELEE